MKKKELKLKKETLTNLTNLNIKEMEELKGGVAAKQEQVYPTITVIGWTMGITVPGPWSLFPI